MNLDNLRNALNEQEIEEKLRKISEAHDKREKPRPAKSNMNFDFGKECDRKSHFINQGLDKSTNYQPPVGIYGPKVVKRNVSVLPHISNEVQPKIERLEKWVNLRKLDERKDIEIQFSEIGKQKSVVPTLNHYKQTGRHDLRNTRGTRFQNKHGYWPTFVDSVNTSTFGEPLKKTRSNARYYLL